MITSETRRTLRQPLQADAERSGVSLPGGPVFLLTHLRYLAYAFNPESFYYCYDRVKILNY